MKLIFVHFGNPPSHLTENILDVCERFPDREIVLVSDFSLKKIISFPNYSEKYLSVANLFELFESKSALPVEFRGGFWLLSLIRLVVLSEIMEMESSPILHIESDVVLASDFPYEFFDELKHKIAFVRVSDSEAIASLIYIPTTESARHMRAAIFQELDLNPGLTDMTFLSNYSVKYPDRVLELPTSLDDDISCDFVFDGSDYGQYLFGTDPRNLRGIKILNFNNPRTRIDVGTLDFRFNQSRDFIDIAHGRTSKRLVNLHIHSKNLNLFRATPRLSEFKSACLRNRENEERIFVPRIFLMQIRFAIYRRVIRWWKDE